MPCLSKICPDNALGLNLVKMLTFSFVIFLTYLSIAGALHPEFFLSYCRAYFKFIVFSP